MGLWREARGVGGQGHPDTLQPSFDHDDGDVLMMVLNVDDTDDDSDIEMRW